MRVVFSSLRRLNLEALGAEHRKEHGEQAHSTDKATGGCCLSHVQVMPPCTDRFVNSSFLRDVIKDRFLLQNPVVQAQGIWARKEISTRMLAAQDQALHLIAHRVL